MMRSVGSSGGPGVLNLASARLRLYSSMCIPTIKLRPGLCRSIADLLTYASASIREGATEAAQMGGRQHEEFGRGPRGRERRLRLSLARRAVRGHAGRGAAVWRRSSPQGDKDRVVRRFRAAKQDYDNNYGNKRGQ